MRTTIDCCAAIDCSPGGATVNAVVPCGEAMTTDVSARPSLLATNRSCVAVVFTTTSPKSKASPDSVARPRTARPRRPTSAPLLSGESVTSWSMRCCVPSWGGRYRTLTFTDAPGPRFAGRPLTSNAASASSTRLVTVMATRPALRSTMGRVCSLPSATSPKSSVAGETERTPPSARTLDWLAPPHAANTSTHAAVRTCPIRHPREPRHRAGPLHGPCQGPGRGAGACGIGKPLPSRGRRCSGGLQRFAHDGRVGRSGRRSGARGAGAGKGPRTAQDGVVAAARPARRLRLVREERAAAGSHHGPRRAGRAGRAQREGKRGGGMQGMQQPQKADDTRGATHDEASGPAPRGLMPLSEKDFPVEERSLKNGLQIRLLRDNSLPVCTLYGFFRVGSRNERPGITGISHLFEHMMFNGSKKYGPKEFDRRLEAAGGTSNAYTSTDITAYYEDFAAEALPLVLDLEADRMASLVIDDESLARERGVVKEERRFRTDNDIDGMMDEALGALAFLAHPYRWPVIGWMSDIEAITRQDCERYFRSYYAPSNCTLVLVGDFEADAAMREIERLYGGIAPGEPLPAVTTSEPRQKGARRAEIRYPSQAPALLAGFRGPSGRDPDSLVLDLIETALSSGEGARLKRALVYEQELCVDSHVYYGWRMDPGLFEISLKLNPGVDPQRAESSLWAELSRLSDEQISERELERAKNLVRNQLLRALATTNGRAHTIGQMEVMLGTWRAMLDLPDRYASITAADVQRVARKTFAPHRRNVVTLVPGEVEA